MVAHCRNESAGRSVRRSLRAPANYMADFTGSCSLRLQWRASVRVEQSTEV